MPELPEVETVVNGLSPHLIGKKFRQVNVYQSCLRWPVPSDLSKQIVNQPILSITRRAKYILIGFKDTYLLIHLGMSGRLVLTTQNTVLKKHDHVEFIIDKSTVLRYHDPRRFGAVLLADLNIESNKLFHHLGPEPLSSDFTASYLFNRAKKLTVPLKNFIMNNKIVVGVGNIYANESLFLAKLSPLLPANQLTLKTADKLVKSIQQVLNQAILAGGTSFRDYRDANGEAGYFAQELFVYGRKNLPCKKCHLPLMEIRMMNRSTVFCNRCQKVKNLPNKT